MASVTNTTSSPGTGGLLAANLVCMLSMFLAAVGLPAADFLFPKIGAEQLTALRLALAALALLPFWLLADGSRAILRANWPKGIAIGSLITAASWLVVTGQAMSSPVTAAVATAMMPLFGIALEVMLDGRKLSRGLVIGVALSLVGAVLTLDFRAGGLTLGLGALLCLLSTGSFALGSRLTVTQFPQLSATGRAALTVSGAALVALVIAAAQIALGTPMADLSGWGRAEWGAIILFGVLALGVSQLLWISSVAKLGIGLSSLHINGAPFYVMLVLFALGGRWDWGQAGAACIVALGVLIAQGVIPVGGRRA